MTNQYIKSENLLRAIRRKVFDYPDSKDAQVKRVMEYLKQRKMRGYNPKVGYYSGLTVAELRRTGLCETDFF